MNYPMMMKKTALFVYIFLSLAFCSVAQNTKDTVIDYMHVPGPIQFGNTDYKLAWSSHPLDNYYKQEYLVKGDTLEHFNSMVLVDLLEDTVDAKDLAYIKIRSLENRKKTDAVTQYNLIQSPDSSEFIIDFLVSEGTPLANTVEWNVYRYVSFNKKGHRGVILYGISTRAYGNKIPDFLNNLPQLREKVTTQLIDFRPPMITINNGVR